MNDELCYLNMHKLRYLIILLINKTLFKDDDELKLTKPKTKIISQSQIYNHMLFIND